MSTRIYVTQLKNSIREKIDRIEDAEYLSTLEAILTYETYGYPVRKEKQKVRVPFWKRFWLTSH